MTSRGEQAVDAGVHSARNGAHQAAHVVRGSAQPALRRPLGGQRWLEASTLGPAGRGTAMHAGRAAIGYMLRSLRARDGARTRKPLSRQRI